MNLTKPLSVTRALWCIVAVQACAPPVPPPPPYAMVTSTLELNMSAAAVTAMNPYVEDSLTYWVNNPFQTAAMVDFRWLPGNWSLPNPPTADGVWWPTSQIDMYRSWAEAYGTTGGPDNVQFHVFFVGHMGTNTNTSSCTGIGTTYGLTITIEGLPNQYVWDGRDRATFMFAEDIEDILNACAIADDGRLNAVVAMVTHELGHQRAGLTHSDDPQYSQYHVQAYYYNDVMREYLTPLDLTARREPVFCATQDQPPPEGNTESCKGILVKNRSVM